MSGRLECSLRTLEAVSCAPPGVAGPCQPARFASWAAGVPWRLKTAATAEPSKECMQAEIAQGTAVSGSAKCTAASMAPRVLFCLHPDAPPPSRNF